MLTYDMARQMVDAAVAHARANGLAMTIAVVDQAGTRVALGRMDGSHFMAPEIARGKAYGSAAFGLPSAELARRAEESSVFYSSLTTLVGGKFVAAQGALPIRLNGQLVGAIGATGSKPQVDEEVARAGLAAVPGADH